MGINHCKCTCMTSLYRHIGIPYTTNACWLRFSPKAHTVYWDKNFANGASYLPGSCGWSSQVARRICACTHDRANMSKFSLCEKNSRKKFHQWHLLAKLAKIFSWQKFPHIRYFRGAISLIQRRESKTPAIKYQILIHSACPYTV